MYYCHIYRMIGFWICYALHFVFQLLYYGPTSIGRVPEGHYVCLSVTCLDLTTTERLRKPKIGMMEAHNMSNPWTYRVIGSNVKMTRPINAFRIVMRHQSICRALQVHVDIWLFWQRQCGIWRSAGIPVMQRWKWKHIPLNKVEGITTENCLVNDAVTCHMKARLNCVLILCVSLSVDAGNKIDEPGAEALLYAVREQTTLSPSSSLTKVPNIGLLRLCIQVFASSFSFVK